MARVFYLSHPQVRIDPAVPVPEWGLSERGRERLAALRGAAWLAGVPRIVASAERKAIETAEILAGFTGAGVSIGEDLHENDRSATGFLPPPEFEATADQFFARPDESVRGWERARDAQARIVAAVARVLEAEGDAGADLLLVGHGGVGTLLACGLAGLAIDRRHDQPPNGGGNVFAFDRATRRMLHPWRPIEAPGIGEPP